MLTSKEFDWIVLAALFISANVVSEAVTYTTYIKDVSAEARRTGALFYGFIPLSGAKMIAVLLSMHVLSFCQLIGKRLRSHC